MEIHKTKIIPKNNIIIIDNITCIILDSYEDHPDVFAKIIYKNEIKVAYYLFNREQWKMSNMTYRDSVLDSLIHKIELYKSTIDTMKNIKVDELILCKYKKFIENIERKYESMMRIIK